jgi:hypothetical protein
MKQPYFFSFWNGARHYWRGQCVFWFYLVQWATTTIASKKRRIERRTRIVLALTRAHRLRGLTMGPMGMGWKAVRWCRFTVAYASGMISSVREGKKFKYLLKNEVLN